MFFQHKKIATFFPSFDLIDDLVYFGCSMQLKCKKPHFDMLQIVRQNWNVHLCSLLSGFFVVVVSDSPQKKKPDEIEMDAIKR